jgi:multidrug transporter EmrE-like cation transporter
MKSKDFFDQIIGSINWKIGGFNMLPVFFGILLALVDIVMMSTTKMVSMGTIPSWWGTPLAVGVYSLTPLIFLKSLKYESMLVMNLIWDLTSDIIVTLQAIFVFGEKIKGLKWVGVTLSLISLGLMAYSDQ